VLLQPGQKVLRQLQDGDLVLMNRQVRPCFIIRMCVADLSCVVPMIQNYHSTPKAHGPLWFYTKFHNEGTH
jgi:hypothetical protein